MTTVLVCAGVPAMRESLVRSVTVVPGVTRVDAVASSEELFAMPPQRRADLVFLDVRLPSIGGVETTRLLLRDRPETAVVVLSVASDRELVSTAIAVGARGWLMHPVSREELCAAVAAALQPPARPTTPRPTMSPELTERELQVLQGMAAGMSNAQIGRELYLSEDTIKTHARRLYRKLEVTDRAQAVASGFRLGLVR